MIAKLYTFYNLPFDHNVCHLFEHIVIRQFLFTLRKHGYDRAFFGQLHGQVVDSAIFFELNAYNQEIARLFKHHLTTLEGFDDAIIDQSLAHIEAETKAEITITDKPLLRQQLQELARVMKQPRSTTSTPTRSPLVILEKPQLFQDIATILSIYSPSEETQKAFLCFYSPLLDVIRDAAIDTSASYLTGTSSLGMRGDDIHIAQRYTVKRSVDIATLKNGTQAYLRGLNIADYTKRIDGYRTIFKRDPQYNAAPIRFYEETGIATTRKELAQFITPHYLQEVIDSMIIRFEPVNNKLKKIDWKM